MSLLGFHPNVNSAWLTQNMDIWTNHTHVHCPKKIANPAPLTFSEKTLSPYGNTCNLVPPHQDHKPSKVIVIYVPDQRCRPFHLIRG